VIIGGQVLSLVLTLVAIPVIYSLFDDLARLRILNRLTRAVGGLWTSLVAALTPRRAARSSAELLGGDAGGGEE